MGSALATVQQGFEQFKTIAKRSTRRQHKTVIPAPSNGDLDSVHRKCLPDETPDVRPLPDGSSATDMTDQNAMAGSLAVSDQVCITWHRCFDICLLLKLMFDIDTEINIFVFRGYRHCHRHHHVCLFKK